MTTKTRLYLGSIIAVGVGLIATCLVIGWGSHSNAYWTYCLLACLSSTLKVRLPGITGTMSVNFLFVLVSIGAFSFAETVLLAAVACLVQCLARTKRRPRPVQVVFNAAVLAISAAASFRLAHYFAFNEDGRGLLLLCIAAAIYFGANTLLISGVLSLVESRPLFQVWQQCYLWSFPYYLVGAAIAGLVVETGRTQGWPMSLLILPIMYLLYVFYRILVERMAHTASAA